MTVFYDVLILGAGASGLVCAAESARRGRKTLLLDHGPVAGQKILMAGGGKCNFTNNDVSPANYLSNNTHFCKSALSRFTQWDFMALLQNYGIDFEERGLGQLFAADSARDIRDMLLKELESSGSALRTGVSIDSVSRKESGLFEIQCGRSIYTASSLIVATGGLSYTSAGASPLGYRIAEQFEIPVTPLSPGLVPLTLNKIDKERFSPLSGIAVDTRVSTGGQEFRENLLFTHRGLSGPVILQASNYWQPGKELSIDLLPAQSIDAMIEESRSDTPDRLLKGFLGQLLPKRLVAAFISPEISERRLKSLTTDECRSLSDIFHRWSVKPNGTEGYRTAEVTCGGVSVDAISSKTFESRDVPGLFFIGEVLDVTGWLGGYNLQWAWSSGWCAGQYS